MSKLSERFSATFWVTTQTTFTQLFGLAVFAIQAPLLGPRVFGLISIVTVFTGFCETVLTEAATDALISLPTIEELHYATMTSINVIFSAALTSGLLILAAPIARIFGDPELVSVIRWMAVLPIISALASAPNAATKRALQFRPLAVRALLGTMTGGAVGIALTLLGGGVWALVWQAIVQRAVSVAALWLAVPGRLHFAVSRRHFAELRHFLGPMVISRTMKWASSQIPRLILGLYLGASELGLFSLACRLADILTQVTVVAKYAVVRLEFREFALNIHGAERTVRGLLEQMSVLYFPMFVGAAAVAPTLFRVWLDRRWLGGIAPAELMLLTGLPSVTLFSAGAILMALNFQRAEAGIAIVETLGTILLVMIAAPFGLLYATAAFALRPFAMLPLTLWLTKGSSGISVRSFLLPQVPALVASLLMGAAVWLLGSLLSATHGAAAVLAVQIAAGIFSYALLISLILPTVAVRVAKPFVARLQAQFGRRV